MIKQLKSIIRNHFGFSRSETNGVLLLIPFTLLTLFSPAWLNYFEHDVNDDLSEDKMALIAWKKELESKLIPVRPERVNTAQTTVLTKSVSVKKRERFEFDPNLASPDELKRLGFQPRVVHTLISYRNAGGRFDRVADLSRIYGMDQKLLDELAGYVKIPERKVSIPAGDSINRRSWPKKVIEIAETDINQTTAADLQQISGIGEKLSGRILKFRDKLGGYHDLVQLREVYGLDSLVAQKVTAHFHISDSISQFPINTVTAEELGAHPYISRKMARVIINYRTQHGAFENEKDLAAIHVLSDSVIAKIKPYLRFEERSDIFRPD